MRHVVYTLYLGDYHLRLLQRGWREHHCLFVDGEVYIKLTIGG
jgi:hypothetical protein